MYCLLFNPCIKSQEGTNFMDKKTEAQRILMAYLGLHTASQGGDSKAGPADTRGDDLTTMLHSLVQGLR